ncbi:hypothetical protein FQN57_006229 [Myotisia sp. PD_48]|nr:hypothetical protein FQN57_006229 [Myotisia sp. PD_48]
MALERVPSSEAKPKPEAFAPPPDVVITPCDPWPRPYYFEKGFRRVAPYHFTYNTYCKERWRGRELLEIFTTEFRDREKEYYRAAIEEGRVTIDGKPAAIDSKVKNGQVVSHTLHRHEPPVTSLPIRVIHEDADIIAIDKPAGVPVHPAGRYNYNSVVEIMRSERGYGFKPLPCNRLDRLTSGVMFFGKHPKAAENMATALRARTIQKEYIARVKGRFPDGVVLCDQPMLKVSPMLGLNRVRSTGKEATTKFVRLAYYPPAESKKKLELSANQPESTPATPPPYLPDPDNVSPIALEEQAIAEPAGPPKPADEDEGYSIVHCLPLTGRTHQIRVHLQFLGHPITNDPIYSNRRVFGTDLGKNDNTGDNDAEIMARLARMGKEEPADSLSYQTFQTPPPAHITQGGNPDIIDELISREHGVMISDYLKRKGERKSGEKCEICGTDLYTDPGVHELGIFLHAVAYADLTGKWKYRSQMPSWAMPPPGVDGPTAVPEWKSNDDNSMVIGRGMVGGDETALVEGLGTMNLSRLLANQTANAAEPTATDI